MKKIIIPIMMAVITFLAASCKKEDNKAIVSSNITAPVITAPTSSTSIAVTPADSTQKLNIKWSKADYGVSAVVSYFVQIDTAGHNFSKKVTIGTTTNADSLSLTFGALNRYIITSLGLAANKACAIELRTGANIYGKDTVYSKAVSLTVTTYKELAPDRLYVPGAYQGWSPGTAPTIPSVTTNTYEGYVYMNTGDYFKFTSAPDFNHINFGDAGNGKLTTDGLAGGLKVNAAGYYKLNADIKKLTYSAALIQSFGIIGTATPHAWDSSTPMTYDATKNTWTVKLNLVAGALKFRANDAWDINYGPSDSNALTGMLTQTDAAINISNAGNYTVTIDMSQSAQKKYLYTVVKN